MKIDLRDVGIPLPSPAELAVILGLPGGGSSALPLHDCSPDPGLFGPASATWLVAREPLLVLGAARALLLQVAHPLVAQGVREHSSFEHNPFKRLTGTVDWFLTVSFGTTREAEQACRTLRAIHSRVRGGLPAGAATAAHPAGTGYDANDPGLGCWVLGTLVETLLVTHEAIVGGLSAADADRFVAEWTPVGLMLGIPEPLLWTTRAELSCYVTAQLRGPAAPGAVSREVGRSVITSPFARGTLRAAGPALAFVAVGLLPAPARQALGIPWTAGHAAGHRGMLRSMRVSLSSGKPARSVPERVPRECEGSMTNAA